MSTTQQQTPQLPQSPDWKISNLYEHSWEIIKKNKVLWIFGMAIIGFAGGGGSNFSSNFDPKNFEKLQEFFNKQQPIPPPETTLNLVSQVLGAATQNSPLPAISQIFAHIPAYLWIILGIEIILFVAISFTISLVSGAWSHAALLQGIQTALIGKQVNIQESSEKAFPSIKSLIGQSILMFLIVLGLILVLLAIAGVGFLINVALGVVLLVVIIPTAVAGLLVVTITGIWAQRLIIFDGKPAWESIKRGYTIAKKKFWAAFILGVVNTITSAIIIGIPIAIIMGFILGGVFSLIGKMQALGFTLLVFGGLLALIFFLGYLLLAGILTAFKASIWTIAYNNIRGKYDRQ